MATKRFNPDGDVRFRARFSESIPGYAHVFLSPERTGGTLGMYGHPLRNLRITCQMSPDIDYSYAHKVQVDEVTSLEDAQRALAIYRAIEKKRNELVESYGWGFVEAGDFGRFVSIAARALGIETIVIETDDGENVYMLGFAVEKINEFIRRTLASYKENQR